MRRFSISPVVQQFYQTRVNDEFVLRGNAGTLKCLVPSFVGDFVQIVEWISDEGDSYSSQMSNDVLNYGMETGFVQYQLREILSFPV